MGLKTTNYKVKTGDILPTAYAIYTGIEQLADTLYEAKFGIYRERSAFKKTAPYEEKKIQFVWDRKQDLVSQAYEESKKVAYQTIINPETNKEEVIEIKKIFTGWDNDIV